MNAHRYLEDDAYNLKRSQDPMHQALARMCGLMHDALYEADKVLEGDQAPKSDHKAIAKVFGYSVAWCVLIETLMQAVEAKKALSDAIQTVCETEGDVLSQDLRDIMEFRLAKAKNQKQG